MNSCKKLKSSCIVTVVNTICRWSYKTQKKFFENTITFKIPHIDVKVIPLINGRWDKGDFWKIMFPNIRRGRLTTVMVVSKYDLVGINLERQCTI